jgi:hypothetical protein
MPPHWWSVSPHATKLTSAGAAIALLVYLLVVEPLDLDAVPTCVWIVEDGGSVIATATVNRRTYPGL